MATKAELKKAIQDRKMDINWKLSYLHVKGVLALLTINHSFALLLIKLEPFD